MGKHTQWLTVVLCTVAALGSAISAAGDDAPRVAAVQGELHLDGADGEGLAGPGARIATGDRLRTGEDGRAKIVFPDGIIDLAPASEIVLRQFRSAASDGGAGSVIELIGGKLRARWVVADPGVSHYQVETPTAVVVRGADFIVAYDEAAAATEIFGLRGDVEVVGRLAVVGGTVNIAPRESTTVRRGQFPVPPEQIDAGRFEQALLGFVIVGTGAADGLAANHPAISGRLMSPRDLPDALPATGEAGEGDVVVGAPRTFLAEELSADLRVNDEPLLEYNRRQPGLPLPPTTGGVEVEF